LGAIIAVDAENKDGATSSTEISISDDEKSRYHIISAYKA
jgi:hypothetical protein